MIYISQTSHRGEPVDRAKIIALAAAIERGDRDEAFHELGTLLERDDECAEWIALGRRNPARPGQLNEGTRA